MITLIMGEYGDNSEIIWDSSDYSCDMLWSLMR
jgi:hypothetical protein